MKFSLQNLPAWQKQIVGAVVGAGVALGAYNVYSVVSPFLPSMPAFHASAPEYTDETRAQKQDDIVAQVQAAMHAAAPDAQ